MQFNSYNSSEKAGLATGFPKAVSLWSSFRVWYLLFFISEIQDINNNFKSRFDNLQWVDLE